MFDIGITRNNEDRTSKCVNDALNEIAKLEVKAVVLSHWYLDYVVVPHHGSCMNNIKVY